MADNVPLPAASGNAAADEATYSGDTAKIQLVRVVDVTGAEGSKTVISSDALVSTANSSAVNIAASGAFTGTSEDVSDYSAVVVSVFSSHVSATDGLQLQQSADGTNWDFVDAFSIPAATGKTFSAAVAAKFFRVVYTNGGTLTTSFRLQSIYSKATKKGSAVRPQDGRSNDNDFEETAAYLNVFNGTTWDRLRGTSGALNVTQPDSTASGSLTAAAQTVVLALDGDSAASVQIGGTWVGTITFEGTLDSTTWFSINGVSASTSAPQPTTTVNGLYRLTPAGLSAMRVHMTAFTSGTATILVRASSGVGGTFANQILPVRKTIDTGRNSRAFMLDAYTAAPVAEALQSVVQWYGNAAVAGTTTPAVVPTGKTLRLTNWAISTKALATFGSAVLRIRANTAGVAVIGSPLVWSAEVGGRVGATTVSATGHLDQQTGVFPEGFEFPAGTGLGFTLAGYGPTGTLTLQGVTRFQVFGYEY